MVFNVETTTIQIRVETRDMLDKLKQFSRETWDDVIVRLAVKALKEPQK